MCKVFSVVTMLATMTVLGAGSGQAQSPGQIPVFDQPGTGACYAAGGNDCIDSVITQGAGGNIGIGTTTPAAKLDIVGGNLNLEDSTATSGNILKGGAPFVHNSGPVNTFVGAGAGNFTVVGDTNTGVGFNALSNVMNGFSNTAVGGLALASDTSGHTNTAVGRGALQSNTEGQQNTATGRSALLINVIGSFNTADGVNALETNFDGIRNTAMGVNALFSNQSGSGHLLLTTEN